ncbi:LysR family transcriptional regulator [Tateyamaria omphalii]|uniref:LysR family transcriptional regulator n=1 Tax=Tateyamaria omphalii TaxID=299262 RepID=UPI001C99A26D|nr:LysR family transcriptional regulator [Tateyamaria omphalii]MBY5934550.1 LysR family transcriptional regulator [Tateyamaria omphalii]
MSRILPPLNALRAFEAAARHESFTRAAEELAVSHSAISRHVRGLEARLGVQLFRDASRGVALTAEGSHYLQRIAPAFDVISDATEGLSDTPAGRVVVNSEPVFAIKIVMPLLAGFQRSFPDVELRVVGSNDLADLDRYEADLAIRYAKTGHLDEPSDLLSNAPIYPFAAPGYLPDDKLLPEHVTERPLLRDRGPNIWIDWVKRAGFDVVVPDPPWRMRANLALEAAVHGAGIYLGASDGTHLDEAAGRLVRVSDVGFRQGSFHLLTSGQSGRRKAVRTVRSWLLDQTTALRRR